MYASSEPLDYFRLLVADPDAIPLFEAAASIALDAYPTLDLQGVLDGVDAMAAEVAKACRGTGSEHARLERLLRFFHQTQGFAGNVTSYYDPDNSYLHRVMETRRGIPISLAVLFVELARGAGLNAEGVGYPGHFLARVNLRDGVAVLDPFTGSLLDRELLARLADANGAPVEQLLAPASNAQILLRMLGNLRQIHLRRDDAAMLEKVEARIRLLAP